MAYNYYRMFFYFLNASAFNGKDMLSKAGITGYDGISNLQPAGPNIVLSGYTTARRAARITAQGQSHPHLSIPVVVDLGLRQPQHEVRRPAHPPVARVSQR